MLRATSTSADVAEALRKNDPARVCPGDMILIR